MSTLVNVGVDYSVGVVCVVVGILLVHHHGALMAVLGLLQLIQTLVKLHVSQLLLNATMGILVRSSS